MDANAWYRKLIAPLSADEDLARREYVLNVILASSIILLSLIDVLMWFERVILGPADTGVSPLTFAIIPVFFVVILALSRRRHPVVAAYLLVAMYLVSDGYALYRWGADLPTALLGCALIIMISGILINARFGFFTTSLIAAYLVALRYLQTNHIITAEDWRNNSATIDAVAYVIIFLIITTVAWLSNREIEKSLGRARQSEAALTEERDSLEVKVEERTRELREAEFEKVKELYRFAEFGQLASGLFHDILNVLNAVSLRLEQPARDTTRSLDNKTAEKTTREIERFVQGMRKQLDHREARESFSLAEGIDQALQLISYKALAEGVQIEFDHETADAFLYFGNPFKFHQLIINLTLNAIDAYAPIPKNDLRRRIVAISLARETNAIVFRIIDHGCGIPAAIREKIFEPFFTTKSGHQGTGIGLASVKKIVEDDFHAAISLKSVGGYGSTFTINLPLHSHEPPFESLSHPPLKPDP